MNNKLFLVMPAYNEQDNIESVIAQWHPVVEKLGNNSRLVIANDGSRDETYPIMERLQSKYPLLIPINKPNSGHGATLMYLYNFAIEHGADFVFQTDSDGQTEPDEFWQFWDNRSCYDFIIGSRKSRQDGFSRVVVTKVLKFVVWVTLQVSVTDSNTPFRLMRTKSLQEVMQYIPTDFFLSNVVISAIAVKKNYTTKWFPITFKPRQGGVNSINIKRIIGIGIKAIGDFIKIKRNLD